jgi:bifunctional non-homologous end joining protein LigD
VVVPAEDGTTDFSVLQNELKGTSRKIVLVAFDLLYLNGYDLRKLALTERKALLKKLITGTDLQFSESFTSPGTEIFQHACKIGLEGIVSKVADSRYNSGRGNGWVKKTCAQRETLTSQASLWTAANGMVFILHDARARILSMPGKSSTGSTRRGPMNCARS